MLQVNVVALTALCHQLIPLLRRHRPGAILNVSSIASLLPIPNLGVYAATKAYVSSFSEALRAELRGTGISVTHLCPGPVDTEFQRVAARNGEPESKHAPDWVKVPVEEVARVALRAVARDQALDRARVLDDDGAVRFSRWCPCSCCGCFSLRSRNRRRARKRCGPPTTPEPYRHDRSPVPERRELFSSCSAS